MASSPMIVIFSTLLVDPDHRDEIDAAVAAWLERTTDYRKGALTYEYLADPADPSKIHFFQVWPDQPTFQTWIESDGHTKDTALRDSPHVKDAWATMYEGCTGTTEMRPPKK